MARAARSGKAARSAGGHERAVPAGRHTTRRRRRGVGIAGLLDGPSSHPDPPASDQSDPSRSLAGGWAVRVAIWALPAYAIGLLWASLTPAVDPAVDPTAWAERATGDGYLAVEVLTGPGLSLLGLVALVGLATLLAGARGRGFAAAGMLAGVAAATVLLPRHGLLLFAAPTLAESAAGGRTAAATYAEMQSRTGDLTTAGFVLLTVAWFLLGVAVWRARVVSRADGMLLMLAAPLLGVAGLHLDMLVPLGALLLLAAGVGIAWHGGKAAQSAAWPSTSTTPTTDGSPTIAR
jgi:hypothetical protein